MNTSKKQPSRKALNLVVDGVIFTGFLIATAPHFTGESIHEWLGLAFGAGIVTHLLLHWQWIVQTTKRIFSKLPRATRVNHALNILLFIAMVVIVFTGLMISKVAMPALGITLAGAGAWKSIHSLATDVAVAIVGLHVALHWQWVVNSLKRYIATPIADRVRALRSPRPVRQTLTPHA